MLLKLLARHSLIVGSGDPEATTPDVPRQYSLFLRLTLHATVLLAAQGNLRLCPRALHWSTNRQVSLPRMAPPARIHLNASSP